MLQRMTDMPGGTIGFEAVGEVEDDDWEETVEPGEIVLAGLRGDRWIKEVCREHEIVETLYNAWHEKLLEGGKATLAGKEKRSGEKQLRKKIAELERTLGSQDLQVGFTGHSSVATTDDRAACWPKDPEQTTTTPGGAVMSGKTDQIIGRGKQGLGAITGDKKTKEEGEIQEQEGKIEEKIDSAVDKTKSAVESLKKTVKRK